MLAENIYIQALVLMLDTLAVVLMVIVKAYLEKFHSLAIVILCAMHLVTVVMIYISLDVLIQIVSIKMHFIF